MRPKPLMPTLIILVSSIINNKRKSHFSTRISSPADCLNCNIKYQQKSIFPPIYFCQKSAENLAFFRLFPSLILYILSRFVRMEQTSRTRTGNYSEIKRRMTAERSLQHMDQIAEQFLALTNEAALYVRRAKIVSASTEAKPPARRRRATSRR